MLNATRFGTNLKKMMEDELKAGKRAARAAVQQVAEEVQKELRDQTFWMLPEGGQRLQRTWRLKVFPRPGVETLRPTALVSSAMPNAAHGFNQGAVIQAKSGKFLAVPTQENRGGGLRSRKPRITPAQMVAAKKQTFVLPIKGSQNKLWCIRVVEDQGPTKTGRTTGGVFAGGRARVGQRRTTVAGRSLSAGQYRSRLLEAGFVPMFVLIKQVKLKKIYDFSETARQASLRMIAALRQGYQVQL